MYEGDTLEVGERGSVSITQVASRKAWSVSGPARVSVTSTAVVSRPAESLKLVYTGNYPSKPITAGAVGAVTVVRGEPDGQLTPFGAVIDRPVVLAWKGNGPVDLLTVKVVDPKGVVIWESAAKDFGPSELTIPETHLKSGVNYRVSVRLSQIRSNGQLIDTQMETLFVVLTPEQIEQLNVAVAEAKSAFPPGLARAFAVGDVLASFGRVAELEKWLSSEAKGAGKGEIDHWMADYLDRMGFKHAAKIRAQRAVDAGYKSGL